MSVSISRHRLLSMASASALIATMVVASMPAATMAASDPHLTGFFRDGKELTAKQIGGAVTGPLDATGYDIAVYNPTSVTKADIHGALYFGIVVDGKSVNTTSSRVHDIGDTPLDGMQRGRAILYINGASGTISNNNVYRFQKTGIEVSGLAADGIALSPVKTSATVQKNVVTGAGHIDYIAQNGIVIRNGASATVKDNTVSRLWYTPDGTEATGLLNYEAGKITVSGNRFDAETRIDGVVTANVEGTSRTTVRPHSVRVDLHSYAKPAAQALLGAKLDWKIKVDGRVKLHITQGFGDDAVYRHHFTTGSGRHVVKVLKNNVVVRRTVVRF